MPFTCLVIRALREIAHHFMGFHCPCERMDYNIVIVRLHSIDRYNKIGSSQVIEYWAWQLIHGYKSRDSDITKILDYYDFSLVHFTTQMVIRIWIQ